MSREKIFDEMKKIFRDVFEDETLEINNETNAEDIEDWDSLEQINLLIAMEKKFEIKFNINEVTSIQNVGEMLELIEGKVS